MWAPAGGQLGSAGGQGVRWSVRWRDRPEICTLGWIGLRGLFVESPVYLCNLASPPPG